MAFRAAVRRHTLARHGAHQTTTTYQVLALYHISIIRIQTLVRLHCSILATVFVGLKVRSRRTMAFGRVDLMLMPCLIFTRPCPYLWPTSGQPCQLARCTTSSKSGSWSDPNISSLHLRWSVSPPRQAAVSYRLKIVNRPLAVVHLVTNRSLCHHHPAASVEAKQSINSTTSLISILIIVRIVTTLENIITSELAGRSSIFRNVLLLFVGEQGRGKESYCYRYPGDRHREDSMTM